MGVRPRDMTGTTADDCWKRFTDAAQAGICGDYTKAKALIESVQERFGDEAAQQQRRELWRFMEKKRHAV